MRAIADCEAIQAPHAYNQCLASFGPVRGQRGASPSGVAGKGARDASDRRAPRSDGRVRIEFTPGQRNW